MSQFLTPLRVWRRDDGRWELIDNLVYASSTIGIVTVPAGFDTDYASVPRLPFMFWLLGDRGHAAAVVHDYLYRTADASRAKADDVFYEALRSDGEDMVSSFVMWLGVRVGGYWSYDVRHSENN